MVLTNKKYIKPQIKENKCECLYEVTTNIKSNVDLLNTSDSFFKKHLENSIIGPKNRVSNLLISNEKSLIEKKSIFKPNENSKLIEIKKNFEKIVKNKNDNKNEEEKIEKSNLKLESIEDFDVNERSETKLLSDDKIGIFENFVIVGVKNEDMNIYSQKDYEEGQEIIFKANILYDYDPYKKNIEEKLRKLLIEFLIYLY